MTPLDEAMLANEEPMLNSLRPEPSKRRTRLMIETLNAMQLAWLIGSFVVVVVVATVATAKSGLKTFENKHMDDTTHSQWYGKKIHLVQGNESSHAHFHFPHSSVKKSHQFVYFTMQYKFTDLPDGADVPSAFDYETPLTVYVAACKHDCDAGEAHGAGTLPSGAWRWLEDGRAHVGRGRCTGGGQSCNEIGVFSTDELRYAAYRVDVVFSYPTVLPDALLGEPVTLRMKPGFHFVDAGFSFLQIAVSAAGVAGTLLVAAYHLASRGVGASLCCWGADGAAAPRASEPSFIENWVPALLVAGLLFDDPFWAAVVYDTRTVGWDLFHVWALSGALATLLFFVPCLVDELARGVAHGDAAAIEGDVARDRRVGERAARALKRGAAYYGLKLAFVLPLAIVTADTFLTCRLHAVYPSYHAYASSKTDTRDVEGRRVALDALAALYFAYVGVLVVRLVAATRRAGLAPPPAAIALLALAIAIASALVALVLSGALYPWPAQPYDFVLSYGLVNALVWTVAILYSPPVCGAAAAAADDDDAAALRGGYTAVSAPQFEGGAGGTLL